MDGDEPDRGDAIRANRRHWDELVAIHERSAFYDVEGFLAGRSSLKPLELHELGDVRGRSLLHLQCHFGLDTLSWARRGARVTGVDFSLPAIDRARHLARVAGLEAAFVCADVLELTAHLAGPFDIVFTSYGVLGWLPDIEGWARTVARFLRAGGTFYMAEVHPASLVFDDRSPSALTVAVPYAPGRPLRWEEQGSYADREAEVTNRITYQWDHGLGKILSALLAVGLRLEFVHEHAFTVFPQFPFLEKGNDRLWRFPEGMPTVPLLFSLRAVRE